MDLIQKIKILSLYEWMYNNITILFIMFIIAVLWLIISLFEAKILWDIDKEIKQKNKMKEYKNNIFMVKKNEKHQ